MKRFFAIILSCILFANLFALPSFALNESNETINEAIEFLVNKRYPIDKVVKRECDDGHVTLVVKVPYLKDPIYYSYECESEGVTIVVAEGDKSNTVVYKSSGKVYIDGNRSRALENEVERPTLGYRSYASYWSATSPAAANNSYPNYYGTVATAKDYGTLIKYLTTSVLISGLAGLFGMTGAVAGGIFSGAVSYLIDYAITYSTSDKKITCSGTIYRNTRSAPLSYYYKYNMTYAMPSGGSTTGVMYMIEDLI